MSLTCSLKVVSTKHQQLKVFSTTSTTTRILTQQKPKICDTFIFFLFDLFITVQLLDTDNFFIVVFFSTQADNGSCTLFVLLVLSMLEFNVEIPNNNKKTLLNKPSDTFVNKQTVKLLNEMFV